MKVLGRPPNAFAHSLRHPVPPAPLTFDSGSNWNTELSQSDAINVMWDESSQEYRVYAKTWIDGIDGGMFWKRAVMMHSSKTFLVGSWKVNHQDLCVYPDEFDVGKNPVAGAPYLPGGGSNGVELHAGPVASIGQDLHVMLVQHLDWTSNGGNLEMELAVSRDGGLRFSRPFRSSLGYAKFLPSNPMPGRFDSGTLWTNAQFIPSKGTTSARAHGTVNLVLPR